MSRKSLKKHVRFEVESERNCSGEIWNYRPTAFDVYKMWPYGPYWPLSHRFSEIRATPYHIDSPPEEPEPLWQYGILSLYGNSALKTFRWIVKIVTCSHHALR